MSITVHYFFTFQFHSLLLSCFSIDCCSLASLSKHKTEDDRPLCHLKCKWVRAFLNTKKSEIRFLMANWIYNTAVLCRSRFFRVSGITGDLKGTPFELTFILFVVALLVWRSLISKAVADLLPFWVVLFDILICSLFLIVEIQTLWQFWKW